MGNSTGNAEWLADYQRGAKEQERREGEARREAFKWIHLVQRTIIEPTDVPEPASDSEPKARAADVKHVLRCLVDHAQAGPDFEGQGRRDGECVLLVRTIARETGLPERTARRALSALVDMDIIVRVSRGRKGGGRGANLYRILSSNNFERR